MLTNTNNPDGFYPVHYSVINIDGESRLHFDFGDYSHIQKRNLDFSKSCVVHRGLIRSSRVYSALLKTLNSTQGRPGFDLNLYLDNLAETISH